MSNQHPTYPAPESVSVIGMGYIGVPTAVILAHSGMRVTGVDIKPEIVEAINDGRLPFNEPGLLDSLHEAVGSGNLRASDEISSADAYIIAVPTPLTDQKQADLTAVKDAARSLALVLKGGELIVLESTVPPGTTAQVAREILSLRSDLTAEPDLPGSIYLAHCPERVLPGRIMDEIVLNDRIVGGLNPQATGRAYAMYAEFCRGSILETDAMSAEVSKLAENAYRDVNIAFANELANLCESAGINVWEVIELANRHPRVEILSPGPGVGGHCIAVDPWFLSDMAPEHFHLIKAARTVNDGRPARVVDQLRSLISARPTMTIALLGITFKPDVDDIRSSPAISVLRSSRESFPQARILVVEPNLDELPMSLQDLAVEKVDLGTAMDVADVICILVDHSAFRSLSFEQLRDRPIIDTRGVLHVGMTT